MKQSRAVGDADGAVELSGAAGIHDDVDDVVALRTISFMKNWCTEYSSMNLLMCCDEPWIHFAHLLLCTPLLYSVNCLLMQVRRIHCTIDLNMQIAMWMLTASRTAFIYVFTISAPWDLSAFCTLGIYAVNRCIVAPSAVPFMHKPKKKENPN